MHRDSVGKDRGIKKALLYGRLAEAVLGPNRLTDSTSRHRRFLTTSSSMVSNCLLFSLNKETALKYFLLFPVLTFKVQATRFFCYI